MRQRDGPSLFAEILRAYSSLRERPTSQSRAPGPLFMSCTCFAVSHFAGASWRSQDTCRRYLIVRERCGAPAILIWISRSPGLLPAEAAARGGAARRRCDVGPPVRRGTSSIAEASPGDVAGMVSYVRLTHPPRYNTPYSNGSSGTRRSATLIRRSRHQVAGRLDLHRKWQA